MIIRTITWEEYDSLTVLYSTEFLQSVQQGNKMKDNGWNVEYIRAEENGETKVLAMLGILPLMKVFRFCYIPRGFICNYHDEKTVKEFTSLLKDYLKKKNVVYMEMEPLVVLKERDVNGDIVAGDIDNSDVVEILKKSGYEQLPLKQGYDLSKECRFMSLLYLDGKTEDEVYRSFSVQTRQDIRTATKYCVKVRELDESEIDVLETMEKKTSERHHFSGFSDAFIRSLFHYFGKENVFVPYAYLDINEYETYINRESARLQKETEETEAFLKEHPVNVKKQKKLKTDKEFRDSLFRKLEDMNRLKEQYGSEVPLACGLFLQYRDKMYYLIGASKYEFRTYRGPYAIQWHMIRKAIERKCSVYNFYGISGYFKPGEEGYGVFDFKRGFNAVVEEYIGNFILPVKPAVYKLYKIIKGN